jgi:hypothetical protein
MRRNGRYRVVRHDQPERIPFDDRLEIQDPSWLMPAFRLAITGVVALTAWVIVTIAERAVGR